MLNKTISLTAILMLLGACSADSDQLSRDPLYDGTSHKDAIQFAKAEASDDDGKSYLAQSSDDGSEDEDLFPYDDEELDPNDPLETPNRFIFAANETLDVVLIKPAAMTYRFLLPDGVRDSIRNFLRNLRSPVILANDVFQGDEERVNTTFKRFFINSTLGVAGLFDVAETMGHPFHDEDFGQTLGSYDVGEGFYLVLPVLGPSSLRDGTGKVVDYFLDPLTYLVDSEILLARAALTGLDERSRNIESVEEIKKDSVDFYARVRSLYRQHRDMLIRNGESEDEFEVPGVSSLGNPLDKDLENLVANDPPQRRQDGLATSDFLY